MLFFHLLSTRLLESSCVLVSVSKGEQHGWMQDSQMNVHKHVCLATDVFSQLGVK